MTEALIGIGALIAIILGALGFGKYSERAKTKERDAKSYADTKDRMQDATLGDNPSDGALRDFLRSRDPDQR